MAFFECGAKSEQVFNGKHRLPAGDHARWIGVCVIHAVVLSEILAARILQLVHVLAIGRTRAGDVSHIGQTAGAEIAEAVLLSPILVEEIEEVVNVHTDNEFVAFGDAREFLLEAHVQLVDPRLIRSIAFSNLAATRVQVCIATDEVLEGLDIGSGGPCLVCDLRVIDQRDIGQIDVANGIAVYIIAKCPAIGQATAAVVVHRDRGLIVSEESVIPAQRCLDRQRHLKA